MKIKEFSYYPVKNSRQENYEGIIVTMPVKFLYDLGVSYFSRNYYPGYENHYSRKSLNIYGFREYIRQMEIVIKDENTCWFHKMGTKPKKEVLYCYITVLGSILYRGNIAGFEPGGKKKFDDGRDCEAKHWLVLTHPFVKAPEKILFKGFQGFRYTHKLF